MCFPCYHSEWLSSYVGPITHYTQLPFCFFHCLTKWKSYFVSTQLSSGVNKRQTLSMLHGQRSPLLSCPVPSFLQWLCGVDLCWHHLKGMTTIEGLILNQRKYTVSMWKEEKNPFLIFPSLLPPLQSAFYQRPLPPDSGSIVTSFIEGNGHPPKREGAEHVLYEDAPLLQYM